MSIATNIERLHALAGFLPRPDCPWESTPQFLPAATDEQISKLAAATGFVLPRSLIDFFRLNDAVVGMSIHNGYYIGGADKLLRMIQRNDIFRVDDREPAVPIATDGGGNAFLIYGDGRVERWNHETEQCEFVADSFDDFLARVTEDWEAFVNDRSDWTYLV